MLHRFIAASLAISILLLNYICVPPCLAQYNQPTQYGMNVGPSIYYGSDAMFVDLLMHATGWWTNPPKYIPLTPEGYPASGGGTSFFYLDGYRSGNYQFYGEGDFTINPRGGTMVPGSFQKNGNVTTGLIHFDISPPESGGFNGTKNPTVCLFDVTVNDPNNPPNNFHLIHPDYPAWPNTNSIFTKQFLDGLAPFQVIRVMDWMGTNGSTVSNWNDRPSPTLYGDGNRNWAYERFIELANAAKCDLWVNIPLYATDDWATQFATLLAKNLDPKLHVYYEFSNECWNWGFSQWAPIEQWAQANPALTAQGAWERHSQEVAFKLMHYATIMQPILGTRGRPVYAGQLGGVSYTAGAALDWINTAYGPPSQHIWGISGASYFSLSSADPTPASIGDVMTSMNDDINSEVATEVGQYIALARKYNVQFACYESGQSLDGGDPSSAPLYQAAQYDPGMGTAYQNLGKVLQSNGTYLNCFYSYVGHDTKFGFWGALPDIRYLSSGGTAKYNAEASLARGGGLNDDKLVPPNQPGNPPGNGAPGIGSRHGMPIKGGKSWPISPGAGRKMIMPRKKIVSH